MRKETDIFTERENTIGYLETDSGTLLITDGIWETLINVNPRNKISVDLGVDRVRVPVIATRQNGRRFILIPVDLAEPITKETEEVVKVDIKADVTEVKDED